MNIEKMFRRLGSHTIVLPALVTVVLGCKHPTPQPPANEKVMALFQMCAANSPQAASLPNAEFWFDDSVSMQGYVTVASAYKTIVNEVVQGTIQSGYSSTIRGFSAGNAVPLDSLVPLGAGFYKAIDTRLASVIETIAAPAAAGTPSERKVIVLVSDLIQAEGTRDALSISAALRRAALRYPYVALYGFRSAFRGNYYVETLPKHRVQVDALDGTGRPFYLLVMAESPEDLHQFQQFAHLLEISSKSDFDPHVFEPSIPPVLVKSASLRADTTAKQWDPYLAHVEWSCGGRLSQIQSYRSKSGVAPGRVELEVELQASEQLPVVVPSRYRAEIRQLDSAFSKVTLASAANVTASGPAAQAACRLRYELPPLTTRRWDIYSIRLRAGDANLSPPEWLAKWSTDDDTIDALQESRNRTLNLATFGEALTRALSEHVVFYDQVIELYRGE